MGYRSDVTLIFYSLNLDELPFASIKLWFDENYPRQVASDEWGATFDTDDHRWVMVTYEQVKWYDDYDHVKEVRAAIGRFNDIFDTADEQKAAWEMVEVGEEVNDIQHTHSEWADFKLWVERRIHLN